MTSTDSEKRQTEINEWEYLNKLETLFMLQLGFLALITLTALSVLSRYGFLTTGFIKYIGFVMFIILVIVITLRSLYTRNVRDKWHWSRRHFSGDGKLPSHVPPEVLKAAITASNMNNNCTPSA